MAYQALYRKYRPKTFSDVVGQEHITNTLKNELSKGKAVHAYLFTGTRGTGKTSCAKILAKAVNCLSPENGDPCLKCESCLSVENGENTDIVEIDAASNNSVDSIRELRDRVAFAPSSSKYRVYIIDEVHMLTISAFNALLKTLEEPPAHAVFILATTEAQKIPATILSRCTRFDFKLIPQKDLEDRLKYVLKTIGKDYEEEAVAALARAGAGSMRDMLSLADPCVSYSEGKLTYADVTAVLGTADFSSTAELCGEILKGDGGAALEKCEAILAEGKSVALLIKDVLQFFNGCAVAKTCVHGEKLLLLPADRYALLKTAAATAENRALVRVLEIFAQAESDCRYTTTPKITLETAVLKAATVKEDEDISAIVQRVKLLEETLEKLQSGASALPAPLATRAQEPAAVAAEMPKTARKTEGEFPEEAPPDENETGGNLYLDNDYIRADKARQARKAQSAAASAAQSGVFDTPFASAPRAAAGAANTGTAATPAAAGAANAATGDAKVTFGKFLRALRAVGNGVLFTICMDMESAFDGGTFVLYTTKETLLNTLKRETNFPVVQSALNKIGITDFDLRLKGKEKDDTNKAIDEIKEKFAGANITVKP